MGTDALLPPVTLEASRMSPTLLKRVAGARGRPGHHFVHHNSLPKPTIGSSATCAAWPDPRVARSETAGALVLLAAFWVILNALPAAMLRRPYHDTAGEHLAGRVLFSDALRSGAWPFWSTLT